MGGEGERGRDREEGEMKAERKGRDEWKGRR